MLSHVRIASMKSRASAGHNLGASKMRRSKKKDTNFRLRENFQIAVSERSKSLI